MTSTLRPNRASLKTPVCPRSLSLLPLELEVLMVLEEDMGGSETYETSTVVGQSGTKSNNNRALFVFTNQDVNLAAQLVSSEDGAEGATPILSYHCI
jgi:hypothetical protein